AVELVAAPIPTGTRRPAVEAPPPPPAPAPAPPKAVTRPAPATKPAAKTPARPTTAPKTASPVTPLPGETPGQGSDIANVKLQGKEFPYPEYLRNLVTQIYRRWARPDGNAALQAEVGFVILRDGTVREIKIIASSRSYSFDNEAQAAVEAAAEARAFGPLPAGYGADYLSIGFLFTPRKLP
ncbi:MAG TPA: TonB family protein, partial [Gemmatimonadales bacterium]|nr:TonB family protein [Gemmatimonadales bacterium]